MKRLHKILIGTVGVLAVAVGTAVAAAPRDDASPGPGWSHGGPWQGGDAAAFAQKRLDRLKTELKITAQQEPAWQAFAGKSIEQAKAMQALHQQHQQQAQARDKSALLSTPDRLARHVDDLRQHLAHLEQTQAAVKDLYAALTPEQRALADRHFDHAFPGHGGRRSHRG